MRNNNNMFSGAHKQRGVVLKISILISAVNRHIVKARLLLDLKTPQTPLLSKGLKLERFKINQLELLCFIEYPLSSGLR